MAKATLRENRPTGPGIPASSGLVYVTDSRGRKLGLRQLPFLEEFRIVEALGSELSANTTYMNMLNPLLYLAEVDGVAIEVPSTKLAAEALIQLAGREGFLAIMDGIVKYFAIDQKAIEQKIKNVDGTPDSGSVAG
jgi:hypothetical protein